MDYTIFAQFPLLRFVFSPPVESALYILACIREIKIVQNNTQGNTAFAREQDVQCKLFPDMKRRSSESLWPVAYWQETDLCKGEYVKTRTALAWLIESGEKVYVSVCVFVPELNCNWDLCARSLACDV